ncbi:MAG: hypothetical protein U0441_08100 [Polyangiaceae bacterium]
MDSSLSLPLRVLLISTLGLAACSGSGGSGGSGGSTSTAGAAGTTVTGGTAGAGGTTMTTDPCMNTEPILQPDGSPSGYVKCSDGSVNRVAAVACVLQNKDTCKGDESFYECHTGADCMGGSNGVCVHEFSEGLTASCRCVYACETDDDCAGGNTCVCAGVSTKEGYTENPFCTKGSDCHAPADCASGECGFGEWNINCNRDAHTFCREGDDQCRVDDDCKSDPSAPTQCQKTDVTGKWKCTDPTCTI